MKILITTDLYTTSTNGVVTSVRNLMEELTKKGHEIRVLTVSEKLKSRQEDNIYYMKSLPLGAIYPDVRMPVSHYHHRFIRELIDWKPDLIHSQCEFFSYQYAGYISRKAGAPIVHTYHTLYEQYVTYIFPSQRIGAFFVGKLSKYRLRKAEAVVAPTAKVETVLKNYGLRNPIHVVPSGIALEQHKMRITKEERKHRRNELGIPEDALVLLNLGRLGTEKNLTEVVEFFAMARERNSKLMLLIVGDGPARKELEEYAYIIDRNRIKMQSTVVVGREASRCRCCHGVVKAVEPIHASQPIRHATSYRQGKIYRPQPLCTSSKSRMHFRLYRSCSLGAEHLHTATHHRRQNGYSEEHDTKTANPLCQ